MNEALYPLLAAVSVAGALFFAGSAVITASGRGRQTAMSRLGSFTEAAPGTPSPGAARALRRGGIGRSRMENHPIARGLRVDLQRAGVEWHLKDYLGAILVSAMVVALLGYNFTGQPLAAMAGFVLGAFLPVMLIRRRAASRAARLNGQVVEVIELLASSLRSGFGFAQSLELAAREQADPISSVLLRTIYEINMGISTEEALARLSERTRDPDLDLVVTAVLIQRRVGGNLAEVLQNISQTIRDRIQVKGEIKTLTAQARMSGIVVGLLPVGLAVVMTALQPAYMRILFVDPVGRMLVGVAITLEMVGFFIVQKIAAIDY